jgi:hypothetical protein
MPQFIQIYNLYTYISMVLTNTHEPAEKHFLRFESWQQNRESMFLVKSDARHQIHSSTKSYYVHVLATGDWNDRLLRGLVRPTNLLFTSWQQTIGMIELLLQDGLKFIVICFWSMRFLRRLFTVLAGPP